MVQGFVQRVALGMAVLAAGAAAAATPVDWQVRRNPANGTCSLQRADAQPLLGRYVSEHDTRQEACAYAKSRFARPARDVDECPNYGPGTRQLCQIDGVELPE